MITPHALPQRALPRDVGSSSAPSHLAQAQQTQQQIDVLSAPPMPPRAVAGKMTQPSISIESAVRRVDTEAPPVAWDTPPPAPNGWVPLPDPIPDEEASWREASERQTRRGQLDAEQRGFRY